MEFNVRVEYESKPVRHIAVQCPECRKWFHGFDITDKSISDEYDIYLAEFCCPICGKVFGEFDHRDHATIEEVGYPDVYKDCLKKKEVWE